MHEGFTYVDVRTESEFADGHPAGAINVPWLKDGPIDPEPNEAFLETMVSSFDRSARLVAMGHGMPARMLKPERQKSLAQWRAEAAKRSAPASSAPARSGTKRK